MLSDTQVKTLTEAINKLAEADISAIMQELARITDETTGSADYNTEAVLSNLSDLLDGDVRTLTEAAALVSGVSSDLTDAAQEAADA